MRSRFVRPTCGALVFTCLLSGLAVGQSTFPEQAPDPKAWAVSLDGEWEFAPPDSDEFLPARVPGYWGQSAHGIKATWKIASQWQSGTFRRQFHLPEGMAGAVVEFDQLRWGGEVLANGQSAGKYDLGFSLTTFDISSLIKPGTNRLDVKPRGWAHIERWEGKHAQIPVGAGNWFGPKEGGIPDSVCLRFYKGARIEPLKITPHIAGPSCDLATRVIAGPADWKGRLAVQVISDDGRTASSVVKRVDVAVKAGQGVDVAVPGIACPGASLWWPEKPVLYRLVAWLEGSDGTPAAVREDTFGFREVAARDGHFYLNHRRMNLFGATHWVMGNMLTLLDENPEQVYNSQVTLFKAMNGVAFRSHQNPLPRKLMDLYDRNGILLFCEFPNFPDVQRQDGQSPYEGPHYWQNLQREIRGIMAARFNHPCIVAWVPSNEGTTFGDWERANLEPFVKSLDSTRLVMFSGDVTADVADQHNFAGLWYGTMAECVRFVAELADLNPDRITGCTEYGQYTGNKMWYGAKWNGRPERPEDRKEFDADFCRILMEQTEAMRRGRFCMLMPYSYGWQGKKANETGRLEDANPAFHALRNAISPLGVSIDFRRHVVAGSTVEVPVWVMSDSEDVKGPVQVTLYLLDQHPGCDWNGNTEGLKVLAKGEYSTELAAWQAHHEAIKLPMPEKDTTGFLAAVVRPKGAAKISAVSLRPVRVYQPLLAARKSLVVAVVERDDKLAKWLKARGHRIVQTYGIPNPDVIVIAEGMIYDERLRTGGAPVTTRTKDGVRLVVLEQRTWEAAVMQGDIKVPLSGIQTVGQTTALENLFPEPVLARTVGPAVDFQRLNGVDNIALRTPIVAIEQVVQAASTQPQPARLTPDAASTQSAATQQAAATSQPSVWSGLLMGYGRGDNPSWAVAYRDFGKGQVLACQVPLIDRVCTEHVEEFDPVAERLLAFLVEGEAIAPADNP